ncbi:HD domain-containing phosphohydrolase [Vibrio sp. SCSIO 43136]|uniref:HD domain-containing phosphohydrolase n=1 Tax=Vibrio sp. SCSIO 43136 TaxID=2819101 RepID=UPI0020750B5B|nr:HD domain-containing phosphohydrolase [Vibrio sp. SCSIO 43136]USD66364.1 HD domain-containing protein [Vibrio sp. SCSIO 43136]
MADTNFQTQNSIPAEAINDFFDDFREAHEQCEISLIELEHDPSNIDLLNALFRSVHTVKGNLVYVGMTSVTPIIQSLEDLLDYIRNGHLEYDSLLCDVILLTFDKTEQMVQAKIENLPPPISVDSVDEICATIAMIGDVAPKDRAKYVEKVLVLYDPDVQLTAPRNEAPSKQLPEDLIAYHEPNTMQFAQISEILTDHKVNMDEDIHFYMSLITPLENRSHYWRGRTARQLFLGMEMNRAAGYPVDKEQLAVAVMLHDIGMSFLPLSLLNKKGTITAEEREAVHHHPQSGYLLLNESIRWHDAAVMILQHHEQVDGSGYPSHLERDQICEGAKILSIVDTFDARTHERAHVTLLKRPLVRTVIEINNYKGKQFDPKWVDVFNQVARNLFGS